VTVIPFYILFHIFWFYLDVVLPFLCREAAIPRSRLLSASPRRGTRENGFRASYLFSIGDEGIRIFFIFSKIKREDFYMKGTLKRVSAFLLLASGRSGFYRWRRASSAPAPAAARTNTDRTQRRRRVIRRSL
jgi:hypothetical protein